MAVRAGHKEELDELDKRLEELRRRFDLFFHGSPEQRLPPTSNEAKLGGELRRLREEEVKNWSTVDKFRFNQIFARFISLDRMWARTLKQIEDGTHKRDKLKVGLAKKREEAQKQDAAKTQLADRPDGLDTETHSADDFSLASRPPQTLERGRAAASSAAGGEAISEQRLKQLYDVYMQAKRRTGETSSLTLEALKRQIDKQVPAIRARHNCERVEFKVVLKDGKAMLKAVPK